MTDPAHPTRLGQPLTGPTDSVISVAFSPDGQDPGRRQLTTTRSGCGT